MSSHKSKFSRVDMPASGKDIYWMLCAGTCQNHVSGEFEATPTQCPICSSSEISEITKQEPMSSTVTGNGTKVDVFIDNDLTTIKARRG